LLSIKGSSRQSFREVSETFPLSHAHVSDDQLREIASALDAAGHLPPSAHPEGKLAQELKAFNSRNSKSKTGPVKTWSYAERKISANPAS
jgi:hypothetical protein